MVDEKQSRQGGPSQPSGPKGDSPATAGKGSTAVASPTPENRGGSIAPSAPNDAVTAPSEQSLARDKKDNNPL